MSDFAVRYEDGRVSFDPYTLFEHMDADAKMLLAEALACDTQVITFVAQQILDRWTENGSNGGRAVIATADPRFGLDWAAREIAKRSGEIAKDEIDRLEKALVSERNQHNNTVAELHKLQDRARGFR